MDTLLQTLRQRRDELVERSVRLADMTRERGVDALSKIQSGALDWTATLAARRAELGDGPSWFRFVPVQRAVIDRAERALLLFGEQVRAQIQRLHPLELGAPTVEPAKPKPRRSDAASKKTASAKAAPAKASASTSSGTRKAKSPAPTAKAAKPTTRLLMPIADYDALTVKEVLAELPRLSPAQCKTVRAHEAQTKQRKTVLAALDART
jgi:hypothetical protein